MNAGGSGSPDLSAYIEVRSLKRALTEVGESGSDVRQLALIVGYGWAQVATPSPRKPQSSIIWLIVWSWCGQLVIDT